MKNLKVTQAAYSSQTLVLNDTETSTTFSIAGIDANNEVIPNIGTPLIDGDCANKAYVDSLSPIANINTYMDATVTDVIYQYSTDFYLYWEVTTSNQGQLAVKSDTSDILLVYSGEITQTFRTRKIIGGGTSALSLTSGSLGYLNNPKSTARDPYSDLFYDSSYNVQEQIRLDQTSFQLINLTPNLMFNVIGSLTFQTQNIILVNFKIYLIEE